MGSLRYFLERNTIRWSQLLKFSITTARGMAWLHSRAPVVLHRDLHSNNILVRI
jgi:serine/threonine protein kinase